MNLYGYGRMMDIDLSSRRIVNRYVEHKFAEEFVGGMGFGCKILYDEVGPEVDPLCMENIVIFANGPLTGTQVPCAGRTEVTNKSPLTGSIGTGNTGGVWGATLKHAGIDLVIIRGQSENPVYLWFDNDIAEIRTANHLWGKDTDLTTDVLTNELNPSKPSDVSVLTIGPAGEHLVRFACTINDYHHAAARGGVGAVLGAKKLKAIAVRGTQLINIARPKVFKEAIRAGHTGNVCSIRFKRGICCPWLLAWEKLSNWISTSMVRDKRAKCSNAIYYQEGRDLLWLPYVLLSSSGG
jgi:aldehyde:ferredoxin oxidoreductase